MQRPGLAEAQRVAACFGECDALRPLPGGHINESFRIRAGGSELLLQWINSVVFPDPDAVADNVACVLRHLARHDPQGGWPTLAFTVDGRERVHDASGVWRALTWLPGRLQIERPANVDEARTGAAGFARFVRALAGLDPECLRPVLPGFHDLDRRLAAFDEALPGAPASRRRLAGPCLDAVMALRERLGAHRTEVSVRVIHGDTKFANLLFTADRSRALAVDYDTVMAGQLGWDFGDMLRSAACSGAEDDPEGGGVRDDILAAAVRGYLDGFGGRLTGAERSTLPSAPARMAFMLGIRFLTDFLAGDRYFRVQRRQQNLDRALHQFALATALAEREDVIASLLR